MFDNFDAGLDSIIPIDNELFIADRKSRKIKYISLEEEKLLEKLPLICMPMELLGTVTTFRQLHMYGTV